MLPASPSARLGPAAGRLAAPASSPGRRRGCSARPPAVRAPRRASSSSAAWPTRPQSAAPDVTCRCIAVAIATAALAVRAAPIRPRVPIRAAGSAIGTCAVRSRRSRFGSALRRDRHPRLSSRRGSRVLPRRHRPDPAAALRHRLRPPVFAAASLIARPSRQAWCVPSGDEHSPHCAAALSPLSPLPLDAHYSPPPLQPDSARPPAAPRPPVPSPDLYRGCPARRPVRSPQRESRQTPTIAPATKLRLSWSEKQDEAVAEPWFWGSVALTRWMTSSRARPGAPG